jgi:hypothetical protein
VGKQKPLSYAGQLQFECAVSNELYEIPRGAKKPKARDTATALRLVFFTILLRSSVYGMIIA